MSGTLVGAAAQHRDHLVARAVGDELALSNSSSRSTKDSSDRRWVEMMMVMLRAASFFSRSRNSASLRTSKCAVGSSRNRTFGLRMSDARETDGLLLAARQAAPAFGDRHVVAQRMTGDEAFDAGETRGRENLLVGRGRLAERDVVAQLAEEQVGVLQHEADAGAQIGRVVLAHVDAIDEDLPSSGS